MNMNMNENDTSFAVRKIREQYMEKEPSELDALRALDARVKRPAQIFSYVFGGVSAVIMGTGMSLVMTDLGAGLGTGVATAIGVTVGVLGLGMALFTYPLHQRLLRARKRRYGDKIMTLSARILEK